MRGGRKGRFRNGLSLNKRNGRTERRQEQKKRRGADEEGSFSETLKQKRNHISGGTEVRMRREEDGKKKGWKKKKAGSKKKKVLGKKPLQVPRGGQPLERPRRDQTSRGVFLFIHLPSWGDRRGKESGGQGSRSSGGSGEA